MAVDDAYTKSLLHFDGADGSTTITDESGKTWTAKNQAQIDTAQSVFGGASLLLDGTDDYIETADSDDFYIPADFTIDWRSRFAALPANGALFTIYAQYTNANDYIEIRILNTSGTYSFEFVHRTGGGAATVITKNSPGLSTATWYHLALTRDGNNWRWFQNGTQFGTTESNALTVANITGSVKIGTFDGVISDRDYNGWIDEFRFSKGIARWTANFTPPDRPYGFVSGCAFTCVL